MFGRMDGVAGGPALALHDSSSGRIYGIGLTMEGIEQNPVVYELMMDHVWRTDAINLDDWLKAYVRNRYGKEDDSLVRAWQILRATAYNGKGIRDGAESIITGRPTFDSTTVWTRTKLNYAPKDLLPAWDLFVSAARRGVKTDGFEFDLVDITRQVLANYASVLQRKWVDGFKSRNEKAFLAGSMDFLNLIIDLDSLLGTRKDFLLGPWLAEARLWGSGPQEKALYERNARDLITLWGDENSPLHEYANRQWSGLLRGFYLRRWIQFFNMLKESFNARKSPDFESFERNIRIWEWNWVNDHRTYALQPIGNSIAKSIEMHKKYRKIIGGSY